MKMTDLEINLALAKIEGIKVSQTGSSSRAFLLIINGDTKDSIWEPTSNEGQAFRLMVKHLDYWNHNMGSYSAGAAPTNARDKHPCRVICLAVLEKVEHE